MNPKPARTPLPSLLLLSLPLFASLPAGCGKYEFNDPTGARATILYDHTGTADAVSRQQTAQATDQRARK